MEKERSLAMTPPPLASITWLWAAISMALFFGGSVLTMWLVKFPVRRRPPPLPGFGPKDGDSQDGAKDTT